MTQNKAYSKVRNAIKYGVLVRPDICERCGKDPGKASDGRSKIHAHHHDYDKPLDVEWLCAKCHRYATPFPDVIGAPCLGEKNGFSKLTVEIVSEIRISKETSRVIASRLGIEKTAVLRVRSGKT